MQFYSKKKSQVSLFLNYHKLQWLFISNRSTNYSYCSNIYSNTAGHKQEES